MKFALTTALVGAVASASEPVAQKHTFKNCEGPTDRRDYEANGVIINLENGRWNDRTFHQNNAIDWNTDTPPVYPFKSLREITTNQ